jgi:16S rRNA G966 N2-methylase RsmD
MSVARFSLKGEEGRSAAHAGLAPIAISRQGALAVGLFDVVFHDPPFEEIFESSESDLQLLIPLARRGGWIFHERGDDSVFHPSGLEPADCRRYGTTRFLIFRPSGHQQPC